MLFQGLFVKLTIRLVREISPQLKVSALCSFDVRSDVLVDFGNRVSHQQLEQDGLLACLCPDPKVDDVCCINLVLFNVCLRAYRFVAVQLANINLLGFLESLLKLFTDGNQLSVLDFVLWELIEELLLGHGARAIDVEYCLEFWVVLHF